MRLAPAPALMLFASLAWAPVAQAGGFDSQRLERDLSVYITAFDRAEAAQAEDDDLVSAAGQLIADEIFALDKAPALYTAALDQLTARADFHPAAIAALGGRLQIRWEAQYLGAFYQAAGQRAQLLEAVDDGI